MFLLIFPLMNNSLRQAFTRDLDEGGVSTVQVQSSSDPLRSGFNAPSSGILSAQINKQSHLTHWEALRHCLRDYLFLFIPL